MPGVLVLTVQQCNGLKPCQTCVRRKLTCSYTPNHNNSNSSNSNTSDIDVDSAASPTKRRHLDTGQTPLPSPLEAPDPVSAQARHVLAPWGQVPKTEERQNDISMPPPPSAVQTPLPPLSASIYESGLVPNSFPKLPNRNNANGLSDETNIYTETRMLQDQTGRLREYRGFIDYQDSKMTLTALCFSLHRRCVDLVYSTVDSHHR